jgi:hypothetical protein
MCNNISSQGIGNLTFADRKLPTILNHATALLHSANALILRQLPMSNTIAAQFVSHYLSGLSAMTA